MQQNQPRATIDEVAREFEAGAPSTGELSRFAFEDWLTLILFWAMAICVFLQFFTRYVLNDSFSWTEEAASNLLVLVVFLGSASCVRLSRHVQVDFLYRYLPHAVARGLATFVDVVRILFFAYAVVLLWRYLPSVIDERMVSIDISRAALFYMVLGAFVLMTFRAIQVAVQDLRRGYSALERPDLFDAVGE